MRELIRITRCTFLVAVVLVGACTKPSAMVPDSLHGVWRIKDKEGDEFRLKIEQSAGRPAQVSYKLGGPQWYGPLELTPAEGQSWQFRVALPSGPPQSIENIKYVVDQNGRWLVRAYDAIVQDGTVTLRPDAGGLMVNLWSHIEASAWDSEGKPKEQKATSEFVQLQRTDS